MLMSRSINASHPIHVAAPPNERDLLGADRTGSGPLSVTPARPPPGPQGAPAPSAPPGTSTAAGAPGAFISAKEAATRLGVKPATLYAYVSRGMLRSEAGERGRAHRYLAADVEAMLEQRRTRQNPESAVRKALFWGAPVVESSISSIEDGRLHYRGHDAVALARIGGFERVAELLWTGTNAPTRPDEARGTSNAEPPKELATARASGPRWPSVWSPTSKLAALMADVCEPATPLTRLQVLTPLLGASDPLRFDRSEAHVVVTAQRMIMRLAAGLALARGAGAAKRALAAGSVAGALYMALSGAEAADARAVAALDRALIVCAEHELNVSSFAARVAASAGADPYAVVAAALAALGGPKHGGACDRVEALVREVAGPAAASRSLLARTARGEPIPGFGHPLYPSGDPRVLPLLETARSPRPKAFASRARGELDTVLAIVSAMAEHGRDAPTLDLGLVAIAAWLGLPSGSATAIFAIGRIAGWIAHALEQYAMDELIRPRARYVGPKPEGA
jgi:citrate synthase